MRVGVNAFHLSPAIGGLRQYFESLLPALLRAEPRLQIVLFHSSGNAGEVAAVLPAGNARAVSLARPADVRGRILDVDLYFCPFGILDPRPLPVPSVVTLVDVQELHLPHLFSAADHWNRRLHFAGSTRQADAVLTISEFSRSSIARHHGLPEDRIQVAPLFPDPELLGADDPDPGFVGSLPERFLLYPANLWRHKNHELLLHAARLLRDRHGILVTLVLTGHEQPEGFPLERRASELGLASQVLRLGYVGSRELAHLYRNALALVFPSLFEGFGLPLVEAMALGCPVLAADAASIPEVVGDAALLFDPHDPESCAAAIRRAVLEPGLRERLSAEGRLRARAFTPARTAEAHLAAFEAARERFSWGSYLRKRVAIEPWHRLRHYARHGLRPPGYSRAGSS